MEPAVMRFYLLGIEIVFIGAVLVFGRMWRGQERPRDGAGLIAAGSYGLVLPVACVVLSSAGRGVILDNAAAVLFTLVFTAAVAVPIGFRLLGFPPNSVMQWLPVWSVVLRELLGWVLIIGGIIVALGVVVDVIVIISLLIRGLVRRESRAATGVALLLGCLSALIGIAVVFAPQYQWWDGAPQYQWWDAVRPGMGLATVCFAVGVIIFLSARAILPAVSKANSRRSILISVG
jgi:hypothetical protein